MKKIIYILFFIVGFFQTKGEENINDYNETLAIITDRSDYIAGENVWFKLVGSNNFDGTFKSKIAYIEIINSKGYSVSREKTYLNKGESYGQLLLPDTLSTGIYNVIAYTNWNKNSNLNKTEKQILIYNPERILSSRQGKKVNANLEIYHKPLVSGIENIIYFYLQNRSNDTICLKNTKGLIVKDTVCENKYGSMMFIPEIDEKYHLEIKNNDKTIIKELGNIEEEGIMFNLKYRDDLILFDISCSKGYKLFVEKIFYSLNESEDVPVVLKNTMNIVFNRKSLNHGLNNIVFKKEDGTVIEERDFFNIMKLDVLNINGLSENNLNKKSIYTFDISAKEFNNKYGNINGAVSIRKVRSEGNSNIDKRGKYNLSENELNIEGLFRKSNQPNRKIELPEIKGALIEGKVIDNQGNPFVDSDIFLSYPDSSINILINKTDEFGEFSFYIDPRIEKKDIIINTNNNRKDLTILVYNNYLNKYDNIKSYKTDLSKSDKKYLDKLYINYRINSLYNLQDNEKDSLVYSEKIESNSFYKEADKIYMFEDYIELDSIREYFYEIVQEVKVLNAKTNPQFSVVDLKTSVGYAGVPAMFIDGVYVENARTILNYDPKKCERIEIIQQPILLKDRYYYGMVALFTKGYNLKDVKLPAKVSRFEYVINDSITNFKNKLEIINSQPVFRNTLYWNPEFSISSNDKKTYNFYTGDDNSWYEIIVEGYTNDGIPVLARKVFRVGNPEIED